MASASPAARLPLRIVIGMAALTAVAVGMLCLGGWAVWQAWVQWRLVHFAQAVMPLVLGGWFLTGCLRFWSGLAMRRRATGAE